MGQELYKLAIKLRSGYSPRAYMLEIGSGNFFNPLSLEVYSMMGQEGG